MTTQIQIFFSNNFPIFLNYPSSREKKKAQVTLIDEKTFRRATENLIIDINYVAKARAQKKFFISSRSKKPNYNQ